MATFFVEGEDEESAAVVLLESNDLVRVVVAVDDDDAADFLRCLGAGVGVPGEEVVRLVLALPFVAGVELLRPLEAEREGVADCRLQGKFYVRKLVSKVLLYS